MPARVAYSYIRFSTPQQQLGDSLRRQVDAAEKYAREHRLKLSPESYRDLGVSGYDRSNLNKGALAAFLSAVKEGRIKRGSYLLVEKLDRLTRAELSIAVKLLIDLVHAGITVVSMVDEMEWNEKTINDFKDMLLSLALLSRGHEESGRKAQLVRDAWVEKKKNAGKAGPITKECPRWLRVNPKSGRFEVLEDKAESVRKVFDTRLAGHGMVAIARKANIEGWPVPGNGDTWHESLVGRVLRNRAVLGEYQAHEYGEHRKRTVADEAPVSGYYPAIIDEVTFKRAQAMRLRAGPKVGRPGTRNWMRGLLFCECGAPYSLKAKHRLRDGRTYNYYICLNRRLGKTCCPSFRDDMLEPRLLENIAWSTTRAISTDGDKANAIRADIELLQGDKAVTENKIDRLLETVERSGTDIPRLTKRLRDTQRDLSNIQEQLATAERRLLETEEVYPDETTEALNELLETGTPETLAHLHETVSKAVKKVVLFGTRWTLVIVDRRTEIPHVLPLAMPEGIADNRDPLYISGWQVDPYVKARTSAIMEWPNDHPWPPEGAEANAEWAPR